MTNTSQLVAGNQPITVDSATRPALLAFGSIVVFAVDRETEERICLFSLDAGDPLLPLPTESTRRWIIVAVPLEVSCLQPLDDCSSDAGLFALEDWLGKLGTAVAQFRAGEGAQPPKSGRSLILPHGKRIALETGSSAGGLVPVQLTTGAGCLAGVAVPAGTTIALVPGLWLEADTPGSEAEWQILEESETDMPRVLRGTIDLAVPVLFEALDDVKSLRDEASLQRFAARQSLNARVANEAIGALAGVAGATRKVDPLKATGDALFDAVRAAAEGLGITARPAPVAIPANDPVRAIGNASGFRTRTVVLSGKWWRVENGPLLAFREDGSPVALLPGQPGWFGGVRYRIVDPHAGTSVAAGAKTATGLNAFARMLYRPLPEDLSTRNLLRHALKARRSDLRTILIAGIAAGVLGMAAPQGAAVLIGQAIPDADSGMIWQVAFGMIAAAFGSALFLLTQAVATLRAQTAAYATLQSGVWDYLLKLPPVFFRGFTAGQLRMRADAITRIHQILSADALRSLFAGAASVLTLALMLWYSTGLFLIALMSGVVVLVSAWFGARALYRVQRQWQELDELLSGLVLQAVNAVSKLRVAGAATRAFSYWAREYSRKEKLTVSVQTIRDRIQLVNMVTPAVAAALGFLYLLNNPLPLAGFLACSAALTAFLTAVTSATSTGAGLVLTMNLWQRMQTILLAKPEVDSSKIHPGRLRGSIAVENLTFRYRDDGPLILDGVSIRAEPGDCIALTGPSGSGKSTLLNLILRFETPATGAIYMDGRELSGLDIAAVRRQIGVVTQDGRLMAGSIFENICCGGVNTMDEVWEAARSAGLGEDIEGMPMGMHTMVSEGGANLSGGQRQRLLIARALVLKPAILFFDEATSALDNRTQAIVAESLKQLRATRILIAHRLSTIRNADRIYVIEKGRVVQQGTYDDLASQPGLFARLANRQKA